MALGAIELEVFSRQCIASRIVVEIRCVPAHHCVVDTAMVTVTIDAVLLCETGVIAELGADARR